MFLFILGIIAIIAGVLISFGVRSNYPDANEKGKIVSGISMLLGLILGAFLIILSCFTSVSTGRTGVVTTFGKIEDTTFDAGIHFKAPWQKVVEMDNRVQIQEFELSCFSSDIQEVIVLYKVNYQIDKAQAQFIYKNLGADYLNTILLPRVQEAVKSVISKYTAEKIVVNRENLSSEIEDMLLEDVQKYNINIVTTAVANIDFSDSFTNAVEAKQVAEQNKLRAQTEQAQATMEEEQAANRKVISAQAEANVSKIQAEADLEVTKIQADAAEYAGQKEAAKNKAISEYLTNDLIQYYYTQQWDGKLPTVMSGEGSGLLMDVGNLTSDNK